jgi:hypothetical protein
MPYISKTALRFLNSNQKSLPPQHIGINRFSAHPVAENDNIPQQSVSTKCCNRRNMAETG